MAETKIPAIHRVPANVDPALKRHLESVQEALEVRLGRTGDTLDQAVTFRDLIDSGIAVSSLRINRTVGSPTPTPTPLNRSAPTSFTASCAFTKIMLQWAPHGMGPTFAYAQIYRSDGVLLDNALPLDTTRSETYTDAVDYNQTWYYWVRFVSNGTEADGGTPVAGQWSGPVSCTTAENIEEVMDDLSEELSDLPGYTALTTVIDVDIAAARLAAIAGSAYIIRATSAPSVRDTSPTTPLQPFDVWFDTDDNNQAYIRNTANNAWVEARDGTLVTLVNAHASTLTGHTSSIATANTNIATVTTANSALSTTVTNLSATVDTKAQTFAQDGAPADNSANALLDGDLWIDTNDSNKLYRWDGDSWEQMIDPSTSGISVYAQDAEPSGGSYIAGDLWFDTNDNNKLYRYSGSAWVAVDDTRISATSNALTSLTATVTGSGGHASQLTSLTTSVSAKNQTFVQASAPTAIAVGDLWVDSDDNNKMYRASAVGSSNWVAIRDTTIASAQTTANTAISNAAGAQGTADGKVTTFFQNDAPTAEGTGDLWMDTNDGNKLYRWSGSAWAEIQDDAIAQAISNAATAQSTADGKIISFYQNDAPTATSVGDLWVDTNDGNRLYRATATGTGSWVSVRDATIATAQTAAATAITNAATAQGTADGKVTTFFQAGVPGTDVKEGDLWIDSDDNKLYRAANDDSDQIAANEWIEIQDEAIATAITNAATAQSTADGKIVTFYQTSAPTATSVGDLWVDTDDGNKLYRSSATGTGNWVAVGADTNTTFAQDTAPGSSGLITGDLWIDTNSVPANKMYRWDGDSWEAVEDGRLALNATAVSNLSTAVGLSETTSTKIDALETTVNHSTTGLAATSGALGSLTSTVNVKTRTFAQDGTPANPYDPSGENYVLRAGDLWIDTNDDNKMYRWNGSTWFGLPPPKVKTFVEGPTPSAINVGDLWFNTSDDYFLKRASATGTGNWVAVADARIASTAIKVDALEASVGKVYGARVITINASNNVKIETMANAASSTTTATHGISAADVTAGVFISLKNAVATGGLTTTQLNKTFKVTARVNTTQLQVETVGTAATSAATSVTVVDGGTIGVNAGFTQLATVTADMQGNAQAAYVLQVNANGAVGGMVIEANSSASGDDSGVAIQFSADKFAIWNGTVAGTNRTFDGSSASVVILNDDTITLSSADYNALYNTTAVTYSHGGGSAIGGLVNDTVYYVIKVASTTKIKLATTETLATAGTGRVLSAVGSGTSHTVNNITSAPFIVSNGNVYIDAVRIQDAQIVGAKIADATIETAHIIDLNADKIRSGNINSSAVITVGSADTTSAVAQRVQIDTGNGARIIVVDTTTP